MKIITATILIVWSLTIFADPCPDWNKHAAKTNMERLTQEIYYHDDLYFNKNAPVISDDEYDTLTRTLKQWQSCFPKVPAQNYQQKSSDKYTVLHHTPMGSLKKATDKEDIQNFIKTFAEQQLIVQPKIDGIAVELIYQHGKLARASTRGNGIYGMDILHHIEHILAIPKEITNDRKPLIVIHGELFIRLDKIPEAILNQSSSARHLIAGLIVRKEVNKQHLQYTDFFPWYWANSPFETSIESNNQLIHFGFTLLSQHTHSVQSLEGIREVREQYDQKNSAEFLMDGIVIKINNLKLRQHSGWSSDTPNWAIAWKFPPKTATSHVQDIIFTIGRTGKITPILLIEPVEIDNKTISRLSLGSLATLKTKDVAIGDQISIALKGGAIPVLKNVLFRFEKRELPTLPDAKNYTPLTCLSYMPGCEQQFMARMTWFIGQQGLDLPISRSVINNLISDGSIKTLNDILKLTPVSFQKTGMNQAETQQLLTAIRPPKTLKQQLGALSVPGLGSSKLKLLLSCLKGIQDLLEIEKIEVCIAGGFKLSKMMKLYLNQQPVKALIQDLHSHGGPWERDNKL